MKSYQFWIAFLVLLLVCMAASACPPMQVGYYPAAGISTTSYAAFAYVAPPANTVVLQQAPTGNCYGGTASSGIPYSAPALQPLQTVVQPSYSYAVQQTPVVQYAPSVQYETTSLVPAPAFMPSYSTSYASYNVFRSFPAYSSFRTFAPLRSFHHGFVGRGAFFAPRFGFAARFPGGFVRFR